MHSLPGRWRSPRSPISLPCALPCASALALSALLLVDLLCSAAWAAPLSLAIAEQAALADDPGARAHLAEASALRERAVADAQLPDPELSAVAFNFPVDGFAFDQEPITQVRIGLRQRIPGGDERAARGGVTESRADVAAAEATLRVRDVRRAVRGAMADLAWRQRERRELEGATDLLREIERSGLAGYRQGKGAQQDVLRARLEQQVLADRLVSNHAAAAQARAELARWIGDLARDAVPEVPAPHRTLIDLSRAEIASRLGTHPRLGVLRAAESVAQRHVELSRTDYVPDWSVEVAYGARDELTPFGDRPDFLTAGVSVQLPLFTAQRQDRRLAASEGEREAARARHLDGLRGLHQQLDAERAREAGLVERLRIHDAELVPLARENVAAARSGLGAGIVDYAEVVRAALAEIELVLARAQIEWQLTRTRVQLAWLLGDGAAGGLEVSGR